MSWDPAFGRKVIFINPGLVLKTGVIPALIEREYEVYYVEEPRYTKTLLRKFPDSICFFDIDSGMSEEEYLHLILSIENDPDFVNVLVGVISRKTGSTQRNFILNVQLSAGYIPRSGNKDEMIESIAGVCDLNDAKGRRQYVRVSIPDRSEAVFSCTTNSRQVKLSVRDISAVGFACDAIGMTEADFVLNSILQGKLSLGRLELQCTAVLYAMNKKTNGLILIMLFAPKGNPWSLKKNIKAFSAVQLQKIATAICVLGGLDSADYTKKPADAETVEVLGDLEEFKDDGFYDDDDSHSGLKYTDISAKR